MRKIGVYICNYNGCKYVLDNIASLKKQTFVDFDIYVVDNASTDDSIRSISTAYPDVNIIRMMENKGGSGGFEAGIQDSISKGYTYTALLDNDIKLAPDVFEIMYNYLEEHRDTAIVGGKVFVMDRPELVQDFGCKLDFEQFREIPQYIHVPDGSVNMPEVNECDYIPTCAVLIRTDLMVKYGSMPVENFIYYDDVELSYRMVSAGYKVAALGKAKVWHKGGFNKARNNTRIKYYFQRNSLKFFSKYINDNEIDAFIDKALDTVFNRLYGFKSKGMYELFNSTMYAFDDFLHGTLGKADEYKVSEYNCIYTPLQKLSIENKLVWLELIDLDDDEDTMGVCIYLCETMQSANPNLEVCVDISRTRLTKDNLNKYMMHLAKAPNIQITEKSTNLLKNGIKLVQCEHCSKVEKDILPNVYVDRFANCICNEEDYMSYTSLEGMKNFFKQLYKPLMKNAVILHRRK